MNAKTLSMLILVAAMAAGYAQEAQPTENVRETEAQTIAKCLRDLKSDDVDARRRAAMIIGKYRTNETEAAVIRCLRDPDRQVRQSALVSLTEERFLPAMARMDIFRLLQERPAVLDLLINQFPFHSVANVRLCEEEKCRTCQREDRNDEHPCQLGGRIHFTVEQIDDHSQ